jgi:hypothetical protein
MFSVEMDHDEIEITVLDDYGYNEDLKVTLYEDVVYIRQYNEVTDREELIQISPDMWEELMAAINSPEGVFRTVKK